MLHLPRLLVLLVAPLAGIGMAAASNDFDQAVTDLQREANQIRNWNGQIFGLQPPTNMNDVQNDLDALVKSCNGSAPKSAANSKTYVAALSSSFEPAVKNLTQALIDKRSQLKSDGLAGTTRNDLLNEKNSTDIWLSCVASKVSSDQRANTVSVTKKVDADYNAALQAFPPS